MRPHDLFFVVAAGFVAGAVSGGLNITPLTAALAVGVALLPTIFLLKLPRATAVLAAALFLAGNAYYALDDYRYHTALRSAKDIVAFEGVVISDPRRGEFQTAKVALRDSNIRVFLRADPYPELHYGDIVRGKGDSTPPPPDSYGRYMAKERMHGTLFLPEVDVIGTDANFFFSALYSVRHAIKRSIGRLFSAEQAAFMNGILLGDRDEFTPEFLNKLSISGTIHLTALSGLHMAIIVFVAFAVFGAVFWRRERLQFVATFITIALFVAMTGFTVSAVRSSLMAFLVGLAKQANKLYSPRNAIAFAALIITFFNPKAPVYDLGFQLSFAAVLSIIYFAPVLKRLRFFQRAGFAGWRDVLAITLAAQLGVAPIAISNFANFSFTALPANVAIIAIMPVVMVLGFAAVATSSILPPLAAVLGMLTAYLVDYAIGVVELFSAARVMFNPDIGIAAAAAYYGVLIWVSWRWKHEQT